jgi:hypothetical protein
VTTHRRLAVVIACLAAALAPLRVSAQYGSTGQEVQPNNYPPALPERRGPPPRFVFESLGEIALPGPLASSPAFLSGNLVAIPVASGIARVAPEPGAVPEVIAAEAQSPPVWVEAPGGKRRFRATPEGIVEAQTWSRTRKRWVHRWKIVAPNSFLAAPVLIGPRLCYAGLDDLVTCVRASNGHRLWADDLGDRISRPIARWPGTPSEAELKRGEHGIEGEMLLVVPDDGASLIALDAYDGTRLAVFDLPPPRRFASSAIVFAGDRIALARKGYEDKEAALVLLRLNPAAKPKSGAAVPYNDPSPKPAVPSGR